MHDDLQCPPYMFEFSGTLEGHTSSQTLFTKTSVVLTTRGVLVTKHTGFKSHKEVTACAQSSIFIPDKQPSMSVWEASEYSERHEEFLG